MLKWALADKFLVKNTTKQEQIQSVESVLEQGDIMNHFKSELQSKMLDGAQESHIQAANMNMYGDQIMK